MRTWLFNPFTYIAGAKALLIGWCIMIATAIVGYYSNTHFDGAIDVHTGRAGVLPVYLLEQLTDWGTTAILLYIAGLLFSGSRIRAIDVAGTIALARWPMVIAAVIGFGITKTGPIHTTEEALKAITPGTIISGIAIMILAIWVIALTYNAFKVSCNVKGGKAIGGFIAGLLIAEILSHMIVTQVYNRFI